MISLKPTAYRLNNGLARKQTVVSPPIRWLMATILLASTLFSPFLAPPTQTSAWTGDLTSCGSNDLGNWNWPEILKTGGHPANNEKQVWTDFDPEKSSYIIGKGIKNQGQLTIYKSANNSKLKIEKNAITQRNEIIAPGGWFLRATFTENGNGDYADINDYYTTNHSTQVASPIFGGTNDVNPDSNYCITAVKNVDYASSYTGKEYTQNIGYSVPVEQCDTLEFGCWITKAFKGVTETLLGAAQAILQGIAYLFAPQNDQLQGVYNDFTAFFDAKLGFLIFPFEFLINMFNAFTSTANGFCSSGSCALQLPQIHGSTMNIDLLQWRQVSPGLYNMLVNAVRGITVAMLIFGIHKKYLEVIKK